MNGVLGEARARRAPAYRFVNMGPRRVPNLALAVPAAAAPGAAPQLFAEALLEFRPLQAVFQGEPRQEVGVFLLARRGVVLWSDSDPAIAAALIPSVPG